MNLRLNIILIVIVALLLGWYASLQLESRETGFEQLVKKDGMPEYVGDKIVTNVYDANGMPHYFAEAKEVKRYETEEKTVFLDPLISLFDVKTAAKQWQLTANSAEITKDKLLHLRDNVKLEGLEPNLRLQRIETEYLTVDLKTYDIYTDKAVSSFGMGFITSGIGLKGNLKQQIAMLQKDVKTYIEPTKIQQHDNSSN